MGRACWRSCSDNRYYSKLEEILLVDSWNQKAGMEKSESSWKGRHMRKEQDEIFWV